MNDLHRLIPQEAFLESEIFETLDVQSTWEKKKQQPKKFDALIVESWLIKWLNWKQKYRLIATDWTLHRQNLLHLGSCGNTGRGSRTQVECMACNQGVVGLNPGAELFYFTNGVTTFFKPFKEEYF